MKKFLTLTAIILTTVLSPLTSHALSLGVPKQTPKMLCTKSGGTWTDANGTTGTYNWTLENRFYPFGGGAPIMNTVATYGLWDRGSTFGPPFIDVDFEIGRIFFPNGLIVSDYRYNGDFIGRDPGYTKEIVDNQAYPNGVLVQTGFATGVLNTYVDQNIPPANQTDMTLFNTYSGKLAGSTINWQLRLMSRVPVQTGSLVVTGWKVKADSTIRKYTLRLTCTKMPI